MENDLADYIFNYCSDFFTDLEHQACDHHFGTVKFEAFPDSNELARKMKRNFVSEDLEVLKLLENGFPSFVMNTAIRIYAEHKDELNLNLCPKCNGIARTPWAKQCRYCQHSWR